MTADICKGRHPLVRNRRRLPKAAYLPIMSLGPFVVAAAAFTSPSTMTTQKRRNTRLPFGNHGIIRPLHPARLSSLSSTYNSDDNDNEGGNEDTKYVSASRRAQRDEDTRRLDRLADAVPGTTSAIPGAANYAIDTAATEAAYLSSLKSGGESVDYEVTMFTEEGLNNLRSLKVEEATASFRKVYELKPEAYLWQDGLARYYVDDWEGAAESFAANAGRYEMRFGEPASEERIWRDACELKRRTVEGRRRKKRGEKKSAAEKEKKRRMEDSTGLPPEDEAVPKETRKVLRIARDLFASSLNDDAGGVALSRAKLRSICGNYQPPSSPLSSSSDLKMWKLSSWFYLGLHYDSAGDAHEAKRCMKMALRQCPDGSGNSSDVTYVLPVLHMTSRDWYDDDEFEPEEGEGGADGNDEEDDGWDWDGDSLEGGESGVAADGGERQIAVVLGGERIRGKGDEKAMLMQSIEESLEKLKIIELKEELRKRKLRISGSKKELRNRLVDALKKEVGV